MKRKKKRERTHDSGYHCGGCGGKKVGGGGKGYGGIMVMGKMKWKNNKEKKERKM